jgi:hypothetical protein
MLPIETNWLSKIASKGEGDGWRGAGQASAVVLFADFFQVNFASKAALTNKDRL